jgi:glycine cleavage system T protein
MKETPLAELHRARGARMMEYHGWEIPGEFGSAMQEYAALQEGAGLVDLSFRGAFRVTGADRRSWLQGLVTQDVVNLPEGRMTYAAALNPQGQMLSDLRIFALTDALFCDLPAATASFLPEHLDQFLFMEKAEIQDLSGELALISLQGPQSPLVLCACFGSEWAELPFGSVRTCSWQRTELLIARTTHCGEDGYDLFVAASQAAALFTTLCAHRPQFAVHAVGWEALNARRVEAGIPWWGHELDRRVVPFEARLEGAISMKKGCYVGQEIIARLAARGQVNNLLCGLLLENDRIPAPGEEVWGDRKIGRVTSALRSPKLNRVIALAYCRREFNAPGTALHVRYEGGEQSATVANLPFVPDDCPQETVGSRQ